MNFVRSSSTVLVLAATLVVGLGLTACGDNAERTTEDVCRDSCVVQMSVNCSAEQGQPASACETACASAFAAFPKCKSQTQIMLDCPALKMASGWECDAEGHSHPKATACSAEQLALENCASM